MYIYDAIEVLRIYNIAPEIAFFNSCEEEYQKTNDGTNVSTRNLVKGKEILNNICRKFISNPQNSTTRESIIRLIEDLDYICTAIPGISKEYTNEILLKHSLGSRFYNVGKTIMENNILAFIMVMLIATIYPAEWARYQLYLQVYLFMGI